MVQENVLISSCLNLTRATLLKTGGWKTTKVTNSVKSKVKQEWNITWIIEQVLFNNIVQ